MTARFAFQCEDSLAENVEEIAARTDLSESEVIRRLIRLGIQDIDYINDEVLFGEVSIPNTSNATD